MCPSSEIQHEEFTRVKSLFLSDLGSEDRSLCIMSVSSLCACDSEADVELHMCTGAKTPCGFLYENFVRCWELLIEDVFVVKDFERRHIYNFILQ